MINGKVALLVSGSRKFNDSAFMLRSFMQLSETIKAPIHTLVHGAAPGADTIADQLARSHGVQVLDMWAPWKTHGNLAGPLRNAAMLKILDSLRFCGWRCYVMAFPLASDLAAHKGGTFNCMQQAKDWGFEPIVHEFR